MPNAPRLRLSTEVSFQVLGAAVEVFNRGRTMRLTLPLFRLLLQFAEPQPADVVFERLGGTVARADYDDMLAKLQTSGILLPENSIDNPQNESITPDFRDLFQGGLMRDDQLLVAMRAQLDAGRAVVIRDAIDPELATRVHRELEASTAWRPYEHVAPLFHYRHHNLYLENEFPDSLRQCQRAFSEPAARAFMSQLCRRDCNGRPIVGASLYLPGDHSLPHRDLGGSRSVAFVWHLTREWDSTWGGHLYWCPSGTSIAPSFNTFVLFNVMESSLHFVSAVSPWARGRRLAVNGWWNAVSPVGDTAAPPPEDATRVVSDARYGKPHETLTPGGRVVAI